MAEKPTKSQPAKRKYPEAGDWADKITAEILDALGRGAVNPRSMAQRIREAERADAGASVPIRVERRVNGRVVERVFREPEPAYTKRTKATEAVEKASENLAHIAKGANAFAEVTDPEELATVAREALRTAYLAARAYVDGCHAGPCQVCYGAGEVYDVGEVKHIVVGRCLACKGRGVQDCSVEGCKTC